MSSTNTRVELERKLRSITSPWDRLPILIELTKETCREDTDYAYRRGIEALSLAKSLDDRFWIARCSHVIGVELLSQNRYTDVLYHLKRASQIFGELREHQTKAQVDFHLAVALVFTGSFDEAFALLIRNLPIYELMADRIWLARGLRYCGYISRTIGDHDRGLEYYLQALAVANEAGLELELPNVYLYLALSYQEVGDRRNHCKYLFRCLAASRKLENRTGIATAAANIASMYIDRERFARAERFVRISGRLNRELGYAANESIAWCQMGDIYSHRENFPNAFRCYRKGLALARKGEHRVYLGKIFDHFGLACMNAGRPAQAIRYMRKGLQILTEAGYAHFHYELHLHLSTAYESLGDTAKSLEHHKEYIRVRDEYINSRKAFEAGRVEQQAQFRKLAERLTRERSRTASLKIALEKKEAELVSLTLRLVEDGNVRSGNGMRVERTHATSRQKTSHNWDIFAQQFHKVHNGFYADLIRRYPELTPTEVKVCTLIRIGLSSKEIASLLGVSKRTVDSHREHIHKKLNLTSRLAPFIAGL